MGSQESTAFIHSDFPQTIAQIETEIGRKLIAADCLLLEIQALQFDNDQDRLGQFACMLAIGLLIGATTGLVLVTRLAR